jgi:hypothetical protein
MASSARTTPEGLHMLNPSVAELAKPRWGPDTTPRYIYLGEVVPLTRNSKLKIENSIRLRVLG